MSLTLKQVYERLRAKFPQGVSGVVECVGDPYAVIPAAAIVDVCKYLRDDPELRFELDEPAADGSFTGFLLRFEDIGSGSQRLRDFGGNRGAVVFTQRFVFFQCFR